MGKPSDCVMADTLTKCCGIIAAQQICKHCQRVWIGTANLGSSTLITVNWWTDMFALLWKPAWADTSNMSVVVNDSAMQSFMVAVFPECTSLLAVKPVARWSWCFIHSCVCKPVCFVLSYSLHTQSWSCAVKDNCLSGIYTWLCILWSPLRLFITGFGHEHQPCFQALKADVIFRSVEQHKRKTTPP